MPRLHLRHYWLLHEKQNAVCGHGGHALLRSVGTTSSPSCIASPTSPASSPCCVASSSCCETGSVGMAAVLSSKLNKFLIAGGPRPRVPTMRLIPASDPHLHRRNAQGTLRRRRQRARSGRISPPRRSHPVVAQVSPLSWCGIVVMIVGRYEICAGLFAAFLVSAGLTFELRAIAQVSPLNRTLPA